MINLPYVLDLKIISPIFTIIIFIIIKRAFFFFKPNSIFI